LLVLFKVNAFPFKNKDKSHIFHANANFTLCSAAPCLFYFEAICDRYFFKLNCFKLIGWFNRHNVFPPIRSVCYRFLHCCLWLTALKSIHHSRVIFLCILLQMKNPLKISPNNHNICCVGVMYITPTHQILWFLLDYIRIEGTRLSSEISRTRTDLTT
jgi:hypothetical protein